MCMGDSRAFSPMRRGIRHFVRSGRAILFQIDVHGVPECAVRYTEALHAEANGSFCMYEHLDYIVRKGRFMARASS